jgi:hypothetical protein
MILAQSHLQQLNGNNILSKQFLCYTIEIASFRKTFSESRKQQII